jgi:hypothetical protein
MEIALIITGGVVLVSIIAGLFDFLTKRKKKADHVLENKVTEIEQKLQKLEGKLLEKDERINQLESEISFVTRLIEDKTKK